MSSGEPNTPSCSLQQGTVYGGSKYQTFDEKNFISFCTDKIKNKIFLIYQKIQR